MQGVQEACAAKGVAQKIGALEIFRWTRETPSAIFLLNVGEPTFYHRGEVMRHGLEKHRGIPGTRIQRATDVLCPMFSYPTGWRRSLSTAADQGNRVASGGGGKGG